jgi:hypothetical protein
MLSIHQKTFRDQFAMESRDERGKSLLARTGGFLKASVSAAVAAPEYEIRRGKTPVAILRESGSLDIGADHASIIIDGSSYELSRALRKFCLRLDSKVVASATKRIFRRVFDVVWQHKHFTLKQTSFFSTTFAVLEGDQAVGSINWLGVNNPNFDDTIDLPDRIGLEVQIFMAWLVISTRGGGHSGGGDFGGGNGGG